jgi:hypothetical protein
VTRQVLRRGRQARLRNLARKIANFDAVLVDGITRNADTAGVKPGVRDQGFARSAGGGSEMQAAG